MASSHPMRPTHEPGSDARLVAEARRDPDGKRGRDAAELLLSRYRGRVYLWCYRVVRDHELALDMAQEALILAWRALPRFDERAQFSSWLFAIVRNRCLTALRPRKLSRDEAVDPDALLADGEDPLDRVAWTQEEDAVLELIRQELEPLEQEVLWLRAVERVPVDEITRMLAIPSASGARGVLQSARRKLRAKLEARGWDRG